MTNDERNDIERDLSEIEKALGRFSFSPVPPGLRQRVMDRAIEARKSAALTLGMRVLAAVCSVVIVALLVLDPLVGRHEAARLSALLDGRPSTSQVGETTSDLAEVMAGQTYAANRLGRIRLAAAPASREELDRHLAEARKRLKGWLNNETSEDPD